MYNQSCHYGFFEVMEGVDTYKGVSLYNHEIVLCKNPSCPYEICKFYFYTGGEISDNECEYFVTSRRKSKGTF